MILTYVKYIDLMTALDEHCKGKLPKSELQNAIFDRYTNKYTRNFVAENAVGSKRLFIVKLQKTKNNESQRKVFRNFMNQSLPEQKSIKKIGYV